MKAFKFHDTPTARPRILRSVRAIKLVDPKERGPWFIRGIKAGSRDEWWVSLFCDWLEQHQGWGWDYQVPVYGGRTRPGGNVVDFLIHTPGRATALDPMGRYWHTGAREDRMQMMHVARRKGWNLIAWFTDETPTKDATWTYLRRQLHV